MRILVTGSTGIIGSEVKSQLTDACEGAVVVGCSAHADCDVRWRMGVDEPPPALRRRWDVIVHTAASTRWTMTAAQAEVANIDSCRSLQSLVDAATRVVHLSTTMAVTSRQGDPADPWNYRNAYEWSKAASESVMRNISQDAMIIRVPLVIGRRSDGCIRRYNGLYSLLRAWTGGLMPVTVGWEGALAEVVPVDDVAAIVTRAVTSTDKAGSTVIVGRGPDALTLGQLVTIVSQALNTWRVDHGIPALDALKIVEPERWDRFYYPFLAPEVSAARLATIDLLRRFSAYLTDLEPLACTAIIDPVDDAVARSVAAWADAHPRSACRIPLPWHR